MVVEPVRPPVTLVYSRRKGHLGRKENLEVCEEGFLTEPHLLMRKEMVAKFLGVKLEKVKKLGVGVEIW
ncbi:hypothetical protein L484_021531 [Morus notabilis]|uniref:Uncharacterized protein n=1 Tax=Morus notabilis TaxID=981085 RepID=W9S390_9ROSA|nr:hypothetical protein L484_021531 [Morus notabilis]